MRWLPFSATVPCALPKSLYSRVLSSPPPPHLHMRSVVLRGGAAATGPPTIVASRLTAGRLPSATPRASRSLPLLTSHPPSQIQPVVMLRSVAARPASNNSAPPPPLPPTNAKGETSSSHAAGSSGSPPVESAPEVDGGSGKRTSATPIAVCLVPAYDELATELEIASSPQLVEGAEAAYRALGTMIDTMPLPAIMAKGHANRLAVSLAALKVAKPLDDTPTSKTATGDASPSSATAGDAASTIAILAGDAVKPPTGPTPPILAASSSSSLPDWTAFVAPAFSERMETVWAPIAARSGSSLFFLSHPKDKIVSSRLVGITVSTHDGSLKATCSAEEADEDAEDEPSTAPGVVNGEGESTGDGSKAAVANPVMSLCRLLWSNPQTPSPVFATGTLSGKLMKRNRSPPPAVSPLTDVTAPPITSEEKRSKLLARAALTATVNLTVVVAPKRMSPNFQFFYDRLTSASTETERVNAACVFSNSRIYPIIWTFDMMSRLLFKKPLPLYATALPLRAMGLPEDFLTVPLRVEKSIGLELRPDGRWRVASLSSAGVVGSRARLLDFE